MKAPATRRFRRTSAPRHRESGITMVLVAIAMVAIIAMAALSIDVVTLYLAREEAQRSADAAALAAARVISLSGITGDPTNETNSWQAVCGGSTSPASQTAQAVAQQNAIGRIAVASGSVTVTYSAGSGASSNSNTDCSALGGTAAPFGVNPMVSVQVTRASLPTFFSRVWGNTGNTVSATASAEAFNPSNSGNVGNGATGPIIPVQPRCVKPWVVPNHDPLSPAPSKGNYCDQAGGPCNPLVSTADGSITNAGISLNGNNTSGVIGERFWLVPDCQYSGSSCGLRDNPARANHIKTQHIIMNPPNLEYLPGLVGTPVAAVPSCVGASPYQEAIAGCDTSTNYQCGVKDENTLDLGENPAFSGDTTNGAKCLIREGDPTDPQPDGQDTMVLSSYPFQILAGNSSPLTGLEGKPGKPITGSNSIVSLPIFDTKSINSSGTTKVTFVGFLQVFINSVDQYGSIDVTILNVAGCGNGSPTSPGSPVTGSSPVPVRLITPP